MAPGFSKENQSAAEKAWRFGAFELYPGERLLQRDGLPVAVQPKVLDALLLLVERAQHLVSKQELMARLWPDVHVSDANLTNTIVALRKLLGRDAVRTISKYGYRLELPMVGQPGVPRPVYERFLLARDLIEERSLEKMQAARELLWFCLAEDPAFAAGWAWLGRCCWFLDKFGQHTSVNAELASAALGRAFALAPDLAEAHQFYTNLQVDTGSARDAVSRLLARLSGPAREPEMFAGLVQALRFEGLLAESMEAHRCAVALDPATATSVAHTLFLAGDFASAVEAYTGRSAYYLDAAAWAALGLRERAVSLLRQRLDRMALSTLMAALLRSLMAALEGDREESVRWMESADTTREPEVLFYFARHYAFLTMPERTGEILESAARAGFVCPPETLRSDPWFASLRDSAGFEGTLGQAGTRVACARSSYARALGKARALEELLVR
ncbi:MAG TPA: winged helix-turn-helix domain-containing protein [Acidobacteriaceae bacterium]|nr:winged helix-turn-helix domain-containing protein [Acidobacteriaceae bacterium]